MHYLALLAAHMRIDNNVCSIWQILTRTGYVRYCTVNAGYVY